MTNWTKSMEQTFEFYKVDPGTWKDYEKVTSITKCTITWDLSAETLGSCSISTTEEIAECYIRIYLITVQNRVSERHVLGTFLFQTPSKSFNGKHFELNMDGYTPLIELKEKQPPIGYTILSSLGEKTMNTVAGLVDENVRAPISTKKIDSNHILFYDFTANLDDTWLTFIIDLMNNAEYHFVLDETGMILFAPNQDTGSLHPVMTFDDGNSSILYADIEDERDLYSIPNVCEVIYSDGFKNYSVTVENNDPDSPVSIVNRGRRIVYRDTNPTFSGIPTEDILQIYAAQTLRNLSCLEHKITYKHGYCDSVRVGTAVRLNYKLAGLEDVKAKVISQTITCEPGCPVEETAVYTTQLWSDDELWKYQGLY